MTINHKMVPYLFDGDIIDAFKQKYNEDISHLPIPYIIFDDDYHNDSAKRLYLDDPWWRDEVEDDERSRIGAMIMEMLFEEFYPQRYVLIDTSW